MPTPCDHAPKSVSATGEVYCVRCGQVLGFACSYRPCGCPADPRVFGHVHASAPATGRRTEADSTIVVSRGITLRYPA